MKVSNILVGRMNGKISAKDHYAELERMLRVREGNEDGRKGRQIRSEQLRPKHGSSDEEEKGEDDERE